MKKTVFIILVLLSLFLIGNGIKGYYVTSQSCCFGEDCSEENKCVLENNFDQNTVSSLIGIFLLMIAIILYIRRNKK